VLDSAAESSAPAPAIPDLPSLVGESFVLDFVVVDLAQSCPIRRISAPLEVIMR